ncbi:MAG: hypothetical protein KDB07_06105, partial [Planctomycetes bacterium]|nr:hypothetical protein [Planctomycetota bacterium]
MKRAMLFGFLSMAVLGCSTAPNVDLGLLHDARYSRATKTIAEGTKIDPSVFPKEGQSPKGEVVVEIDLADCLTLAERNNRDLMLSRLALTLADARVTVAEGSFDSKVTSSLDVERREQEIDTRLTGDNRDREIETTSSANAGYVMPFKH